MNKGLWKDLDAEMFLMRNFHDGIIENAMVLYDDSDYWGEEEEYTYEDYLDEETDRLWKEMQEENYDCR